jgi:hypothetical protein
LIRRVQNTRAPEYAKRDQVWLHVKPDAMRPLRLAGG